MSSISGNSYRFVIATHPPTGVFHSVSAARAAEAELEQARPL